MNCSKGSHPSKALLLELLDILESEANLSANLEGPDAADAITGETFDGLYADLPAFGQLFFGEDGAEVPWFVVDDRGRFGAVH